MVEVLVSFAVKKVLEKACSLVTEEVILEWGFKEELTRLSKSSLPMIQALLRDAEKKQEHDAAVRAWLEKVKDVACDAEDVLDELTYETLRREVELQKQIKKKVRNFFSPSNNPIKFRVEMAHKIKNINKSLEEIKGEANIYGLVRCVDTTTPAFNLDRETDSFVDESTVIGRKNDASKIVKMIINSSNNEVLSIIPIVGMGGLGKTTFAQLVYNDKEMKSHFDASIWVCVSENFEARRILSECLESLNPNLGRMENMNAILQNLQKELGGKRYLLVLDDVWNEDPEKWESLKSRLLLINTTKGSSIIVTTRSEEVASIMETLPRHHLELLSENECWSIFMNKAFASGGAPRTPDLEVIGKEIVKKCAGVPLAAKMDMNMSVLLLCKYGSKTTLFRVDKDVTSHEKIFDHLCMKWGNLDRVSIKLIYSLPGHDNCMLDDDDDLDNLLFVASHMNISTFDVFVVTNSVFEDNSETISSLVDPQPDFIDTCAPVVPEVDRLPNFCPHKKKSLLSDHWAFGIKDVGQCFDGGANEFRSTLCKYAVKIGFDYEFVKKNIDA